jgi:hypothetical protein
MLIQNKDIIRSIAIAKPRIRHIKGRDINPAPPSINFFLRTCRPLSSSSTSASSVTISSSTTSVAAESSATADDESTTSVVVSFDTE